MMSPSSSFMRGRLARGRRSRLVESLCLLAAAATIPCATSCADFNLPGLLAVPAEVLSPPTVTFVGATLTGAPSARTLAGYYCPDVVSAPLGSGPLICQGLFGPRPSPSALVVTFDLSFHITNPNRIPVPLASVLAAATVFPAASNEKLGAICLSLCPAGAPGCTGTAPPGACEASSRDVRSLSDFVNKSLPQLLIAGGVALATGQRPTFVAPPIAAAGAIDVVARYSFGPEQLLGVLRQLANQSIGQLRAGQAPTFVIPYRLEGTIWFDGGSLGRIAVGWGPAQGTWTLPTNGLIPP